jgi:branched-chain amino acid transport system ATP-binding protein
MSRLLETKALTKIFGGLHALREVDFHVETGEIVSLIGPNGAGKTTFFNVVSGMFVPDSGAVLFRDEDIGGLTPDQITKLGVARTFQNVRLFPNMTVLENIMVAQHCRTKEGVLPALFRTPAFMREEKEIRQRAEETLSFFGTRLFCYRFEQPAFTLSYANRRRLEIARAMATQPELLLLDEPTAGMNPRETQELTELIGKLRDEKGFTIVVIEHDMRVVRDVSDRVIVLDHGVKIAEGPYESVSQDEGVIEAYLGRPASTGESA